VCEVTGVALRPEDDWALDVGAIERALRPNTRMVSVNFPNNPTGAVPSLDSWHRLVQLATNAGSPSSADEVYRGLELEVPSLPQATDLSGTALSLNVMSKAYGLPGLRIGWIACRDRAVLDKLERAKHYTTICNSAPSEVLALIALRAREHLLDRNRRIVAENIPVVSRFFARYPDLFEFAPPDGGCVCFPRYLGADGVEAMCAELVEEAGVLLLPSSIYSSALTETPADRFRVGLGRLDPARPWTCGLPGWRSADDVAGDRSRRDRSGRHAGRGLRDSAMGSDSLRCPQSPVGQRSECSAACTQSYRDAGSVRTAARRRS
jgi:aspartate/methionine/tyrosine aminotransferase